MYVNSYKINDFIFLVARCGQWIIMVKLNLAFTHLNSYMQVGKSKLVVYLYVYT